MWGRAIFLKLILLAEIRSQRRIQFSATSIHNSNSKCVLSQALGYRGKSGLSMKAGRQSRGGPVNRTTEQMCHVLCKDRPGECQGDDTGSVPLGCVIRMKGKR